MSKIIDFFPQTEVRIARLNHVSGGDADIFSKSGRSTHVYVRAFTPVPVRSSTAVQCLVEYSVEEGRSNNTRLLGRTTVTMELENGMRLNKIGGGFKPANYYERIMGEQHGLMDISDRPGISGSYLQTCRIRIDGKGDDDQGNASLEGTLILPLRVEVEDEAPSTPSRSFSRLEMLQGRPFFKSVKLGLPMED
ncbi:hypothetical protein CCO03_07835 [Comamonas serinivorans]|uniref:Uncharacterized protein n=1 Tax=Comamonas serinivorans TaxID=1082851 RepID=A0A1Y0ELR7_9BURK|nr:hypothetical protein [Comamonas serinivorans]ARU04594.1 hypothetical protein CCO03_07835 [Comamonas serinivorans]